ncbi:MAG: hypothetical protein V7707_09000 [Motiliproteus sp.]
MQQGLAMNHALATDGYYFSSEPFRQGQQIEATQLACLLGINHETEIILEARNVVDSSVYQLALTGSLSIIDRHHQPISCQQLRTLPLDQLCEERFEERGWSLIQRPQFHWLQQQLPLGHGSRTIRTCAIEELDHLRSLLLQAA